MTDRDVTCEIDSIGVATITLSRPHTLNSITTEMSVELLPNLCREVSDDPSVRVVVITGAGRGFCSGADISERIPTISAAPNEEHPLRTVGAYVRAVWDIPKPVIAAVNGAAAAGGMSIACAADFRFLAESG